MIEKYNESKDNVKYLTSIEKSLEAMYQGTPEDIIQSLPSLLNNLKIMYNIAKYYGTPERMTIFFQKMTNQMIRRCKEHILDQGKIWDQDQLKLVQNLKVSI